MCLQQLIVEASTFFLEPMMLELRKPNEKVALSLFLFTNQPKPITPILPKETNNKCKPLRRSELDCRPL